MILSNASSIDELKRQLLRLLEEDEEFRYAVAGVIGYREVLEELRELRRKSLEHDKRFEALMREVQELKKKSLEHDKRFEAIERKLLEHDEKFVKVVEEIKRLNEEIRRISEEIKKVWEAIHQVWEVLRDHSRQIARLGDLLGAVAESMYAKFFLDTIVYELAGRGERLVRWERNIVVGGEEIDLLVETEKTVYVVEVKVQPKCKDVGALLAKAEIVQRIYPGKKVVPVLTGTRIGREVIEYAASKGVRVASW